MHCILIVGASGAGKDSLLKAAKAYFTQCGDKKPKVHFIPRYIDRIPDQNEANFYIDTQSFEILQDFFISKWRANSHNYGIAKHCLHKDGINIISISRSAIKDFEAYYENVSVIEVFVPLHILQTRLEQRGRENKAQIAKRLENANKKTYAKNLYRFENAKSLEESGREFVALIENIIFGWDLALGSHSADFVDFGTTSDHKSCSAPKSTKSTTSITALVLSTSPYLQIPRILEEENQAEYEKPIPQSTKTTEFQAESTFCHTERSEVSNLESQADPALTPSLRDLPQGKSWQSIQESTQVDSADNAATINQQPKDSRILELESTFENNAKKSQSKAFFEKVDSSHQAQSLNKSQAAGFAMRNRGFQARGEGSYLVGNDRDPSEESTIYRAKPTPKLEKVDSRENTQNVSELAKDSRISKETSANAERYPLFCDEKCGLQGKSQGSYLSGSECSDFSQPPQIPRKAESLSNNPSKVLHFLGSSDSGGIPVHNCNCGACEEYRKQGKQNLSTSAFLQTESSEYILLDCGIEATATLFDGAKIRAIFLTHFHADHALGLLRLRYSKQHIVCYHPDDKQGFGDLFKHTKSITYQALRPFIPIEIDSYAFTPIPLLHSKPTFGYFIQTPSENIAYLTDCAGLPQQSLEFLQQKSIDICYIDAGAFVDSNGKKDSSNHLSHYEATDIIKALAPKQARLIHISHKILESLRDMHLPFEYVL